MRFQKAYSLIELSIVILILSIFVSGGITVFSASANSNKVKTTKSRIDKIYKAIGSYLFANKALPCPAPINLSKISSSSYGSNSGATVGTCSDLSGVSVVGSSNLVYGSVPVQQLNLSSEMAEDGFGNKIVYIVAQPLTQPDVTISDNVGFGRVSATGYISVYDNVSGSNQIATSDAAFVLISYGANGYGAYPNNSAVQNKISSDVDEINNYSLTSASLAASSSDSDDFDDILFYKTRNQMIVDFDAFGLVLCKAGGTQTLADGVSHTWPLSYYNQVSLSNEVCGSGYKVKNQYPLKRCGAFGVWEGTVTTNCFSS